MPEVGLTIGGFRAAVTSPEPAVIDSVRRRYPTFLQDGRGDWALGVGIDPGRPVPPHDGVVVRRAGAPDRFALSRYDFDGSLDLVRRRADATFSEAHELTFDSWLRVMLSLALIPSHGLLVHAASVVRDGRAYLFPGVSGAGKTTLARLSSDATLLSDELSLVTAGDDDGGACVHGTPFWGELARAGEARSGRLAGIYFLRHAADHAVSSLGPRDALTRLLPTVMSFAREPDVVRRVVDLAAGLVAAVPCFLLDFRRDAGFWRIIERG